MTSGSASGVPGTYREAGRVIAAAILDRVLHHAVTVNIRGNSYRLKDRLKAGLLQPAETVS